MRKFFSRLALCTLAIFMVATCGCEDLGDYADTEEYYDTFGDIVMINGTSRADDDYFYNEESREDFLVDDDGEYKGIAHADYVYVAIPFEKDIEMDSLALYVQSKSDVTLYMNVFVTDTIPSKWRAVADNTVSKEESDKTSGTDSNAQEKEEEENDDPSPDTRVAELTVHLQQGKWSSFVVDIFKVDGQIQKSIQINDGQYVLLQIRNNSGVRVFDQEKKAYVDPQTGLELEKAEFTMTNLLIRSLNTAKDEE